MAITVDDIDWRDSNTEENRKAFIDDELHKLGDSKTAVEFLYDIAWPDIQEWISGSVDIKIERMIATLRTTPKHLPIWNDICKDIGSGTQRIRRLNAAFRESQT